MKKTNGFVLIELVLAMGIILILTGFIVFSLINQQKNVSVNSIVESISADIKSQQIKAMQGFGEDTSQSYGVYLESDNYILFKGVTYVPQDPENFIVNLDPGINITDITFLSNSIVFSSRSGELTTYVNGNSSFTIQDNNLTRSITVTLNRYGVIVSKD